MKNLKYLIAAGLLTISFNVPAGTTIDYGSIDPVVTNDHSNLTEIFNEDIDDDLIDLNNGLYAYEFDEDEIPDYFSIGGNPHNKHTATGDTFILFENIDNLSYGVFALSSLDDDDYGNMFSTMSASTSSNGNHNNRFEIEHIVEYTANRVNSVPIPAAAWLFGSGLIGLVAVARRKK